MSHSLYQRPGFLSAAAALLFILISKVSLADCNVPAWAMRQPTSAADASAICQAYLESEQCVAAQYPSQNAKFSCLTNPWGNPFPGWGQEVLWETNTSWPGGFYVFSWFYKEQKYIIKLARADGLPSESSTILVSSEPGQVTPALVATVVDENSQVVPNVAVQLQANAIPNTGGHQHGDDSVPRRTGTLSSSDSSAAISQNGQVLTGNTGSTGFAFTYKTPNVGGDNRLAATCTGNYQCTQNGPMQVWVGYKGLQAAAVRPNVYYLISNTNDPGHPNNHYFTMIAASVVAVFANLYHAEYPDEAVLHLNDSSLERGGVFDLGHAWKSPHWEHCRGMVVDIRANGGDGSLNITSWNDPRIEEVQDIAAIVGADVAFHVPQDANGVYEWPKRHFHTRLMGPTEGIQCP